MKTNRHLKYALGLSVVANCILGCILARGHLPCESYYNKLYVKNECKSGQLLVNFVQLTDVFSRDLSLPQSAATIIPAGKEALLTFPGDGDISSALFCLVARACNEEGELLESPESKVIFEIFPFNGFRSNTFATASAQDSEVRLRKETLVLRDIDMRRLDSLITDTKKWTQ